ncbi:MAG TPA: hypothetical protein VGC20_14895 [bacterium]
MDWQPFLEFIVFAGIGILGFLLWWLVYDHVLTRGLSTREAVFGRTPNVAVALDVAGGFLAMGLIACRVIGGPALASFALDVEAASLELLGTLVLLALLRWAIAGGLRLWFGSRRDEQGDVISLNNELFRQRNLATGLFSTGLYLILAAGLIELDLLGLTGERLAATWNMLGAWLAGAVTVLLHSWLYLGLGGRQNILRESFHRNNPAAPTSLLGLLAGVLLLNHRLLPPVETGVHAFSLPQHWYFLLLGVGSVFVLRTVLGVLLRGLLGVSIRAELLERHNAAWGVLDGAIIFALFLILIALIA